MERIPQYLEVAKQIGISAPLSILGTFQGVDGYRMEGSNPYPPLLPAPVDRDMLMLPDFLLERFEELDLAIKPMFDAPGML